MFKHPATNYLLGKLFVRKASTRWRDRHPFWTAYFLLSPCLALGLAVGLPLGFALKSFVNNFNFWFLLSLTFGGALWIAIIVREHRRRQTQDASLPISRTQ